MIDLQALEKDVNKDIEPILKEIDSLCEENTKKVLDAMQSVSLSESHFTSTSGYGYNDLGRDAIECIFAKIFHVESALVRNQFVSGSHALSKTLFGLLRPSDILLSITGLPYDTLHEVIGIRKNPSSLESFGVIYEQIDLLHDDFDYEKIEAFLKKKKVKVIEIQRSKGYSTRKSLSIQKLENVIRLIKQVQPLAIVMVDNCYCEFVNTREPTEVGADIVVGSLIKNLGGGIAPNGAYVVGRKDLVSLVGESLTLPGEGMDVGPTLGVNKSILQGLFFAPSVVASALKTAVFASRMLELLGYQVEPRYNEERVDIVENIFFQKKELLIRFCEGIQMGSPVDSHSKPIPSSMPGYDDPVIMAAGCFTQGSSIELSCDGPIRPPYIAYLQGGLTYPSGKYGILKAVEHLLKGNDV